MSEGERQVREATECEVEGRDMMRRRKRRMLKRRTEAKEDTEGGDAVKLGTHHLLPSSELV